MIDKLKNINKFIKLQSNQLLTEFNDKFLISTKIIKINIKFKITLVKVRALILKKIHASGNIRVKIQS